MVISSSTGNISYETEMLQLFPDNSCNISPSRLYALYIFKPCENM